MAVDESTPDEEKSGPVKPAARVTSRAPFGAQPALRTTPMERTPLQGFDAPAMLNNLAIDKLRVFKDELATRWKWAMSMVEVDWNTTARYGRIYPEPAERTPEQQAEIEKLEARQSELVELDDDAWTEELVREAETIEERLDEIEGGIEARAVYRPDEAGDATDGDLTPFLPPDFHRLSTTELA